MENGKLELLTRLAEVQINLYRALLVLETDDSPFNEWKYLNNGYILTKTEKRFAIHRYIGGRTITWVRRDDPERWSKLVGRYLKICGL